MRRAVWVDRRPLPTVRFDPIKQLLFRGKAAKLSRVV
jgi:hypothetical protein